MEFIVEEGDESLASHSDLALIGALINRTGLAQTIMTGIWSPPTHENHPLSSRVGGGSVRGVYFHGKE